jgi:hydrogenase nickel incorporation protein HypA/HybF
MHEFSIATALLDLVVKHTPPGTKLCSVVVEAGPLQGIDPDAMSWAWQAICSAGPCEGSTIEVQFLPWRLHCDACGREYTAPEMLTRCECGSEQTHPLGGDELRLKSLAVDEENGPRTDTNEHNEKKPQMNTDEHR